MESHKGGHCEVVCKQDINELHICRANHLKRVILGFVRPQNGLEMAYAMGLRYREP